MIINWNQNPIRTTFTLTDHEKEIFKLKCIIDEYRDAIVGADFHLAPGEYFDVKRAKEYLQDAIDEKRAEAPFGYNDYLEAMESGYHCGDCTCVPMTCTKCVAESILGTWSTDGLHKHWAYKIDNAVTEGGGINQGIERLRNYDPKPDGIWAEPTHNQMFYDHLPRWKNEAAHALEWLIAYRDAHFKELSDDVS